MGRFWKLISSLKKLKKEYILILVIKTCPLKGHTRKTQQIWSHLEIHSIQKVRDRLNKNVNLHTGVMFLFTLIDSPNFFCAAYYGSYFKNYFRRQRIFCSYRFNEIFFLNSHKLVNFRNFTTVFWRHILETILSEQSIRKKIFFWNCYTKIMYLIKDNVLYIGTVEFLPSIES